MVYQDSVVRKKNKWFKQILQELLLSITETCCFYNAILRICFKYFCLQIVVLCNSFLQYKFKLTIFLKKKIYIYIFTEII